MWGIIKQKRHNTLFNTPSKLNKPICSVTMLNKLRTKSRCVSVLLVLPVPVIKTSLGCVSRRENEMRDKECKGRHVKSGKSCLSFLLKVKISNL